jgi:uncharacterized membrane protein
MSQQLVSLGIIVILIGFALVFIGALTGAQKGESKVAVGGFIGFIPFGFANDKRMLWALLAIMAVFTVFWVFFNLRFFS